jgi:predicted ATP-grasp superfamily ATP-dependent carboligase
MNGGRILCGVDEATGSLAGVRGLNAAGYEPWLGLYHQHTYVALSRASAGVVRVPDATAEPEAYAAKLAEEANRIDADVVLPFTEATLQALCGRNELFDDAILGLPEPEIVRRATDKALLPELCRRAGLETPPTTEVSEKTLDDVDVRFPVVIKPRQSVSAHGEALRREHVAEVHDRSALRRYVLSRPGETFLVQARVEGTLASVCGVAWHGEIVCASHQLSPRIWPTDYGISSYAHTVPRSEQLENGVARLLELVGWSGIFGVQFIVSASKPYLIDLNPRIYGSAALAIAAGHNLPAIWADLLLGRKPLIKPYRVGVRYRADLNDLRSIAVELRRGNRGAALRGLVPHRHTVHAVFALRDPRPGLELLRQAAASTAYGVVSLFSKPSSLRHASRWISRHSASTDCSPSSVRTLNAEESER